MKPRHLTSLILAAMVAKSAAVTFTWTGDSDSSWEDPTNWNPNTDFPFESDIALLDTPSDANLDITLGFSQFAAGLKIVNPAGPVSLSGSMLTLGTSGIDMSSATQDLIISSNLSTAAGKQVWNVASGRTLTLSTATFTRANNATLNLQGAGTITATMTGLANAGSTNIIGAWATVGAGANTKYATRDVSNNLVGYTGTAATNLPPAGGTGNENYDVSGTTNQTPGSFRNFNTARYTGAGITWTMNTGFNVKGGFLNAGTGVFTINGGSAINMTGSEFVLHAASANIDMPARLTGGANLMIVGPNAVSLGGANAYTGTTTVNSGTLRFTKFQAFYNSVIDATTAAKLTVNSGATAAFNIGAASGEFIESDIDLLFTASNGSVGFKAGSTLGLDTTNAVGGNYTYGTAIADPNGNSIGLTKLGIGALTLADTNTYTGTTTVSAGALVTTNTAALPGYNTAGKVVFNGGTVGVQVGGSGWTTGEVDTLLASATKTSGALGIDTTNGDLNQWMPFTTGTLGSTLGLTKLGSNTLTLDQANTYTGGTIISGGTLALSGSGTLGSATGALAVATGGTLDLGGTTRTVAGVTLSGGTISNGMLTGTSYTSTGGTISADLGNSAATFTQTSGTTALSGTNSYSGGTTVSGGTLNINDDAALGAVPGSPATKLTFTGSGTLSGGASTVSLHANRNIQINTGTTATFNAGGVSNELTLNGVVSNQSNTGNFNLATSTTNATTGTVVLAGSNNFAVGSTINLGGSTDKGGGILRLANGNALGSSAITINATGGNSNWVGGVVELSGGITIGTTVTFNISGHGQGGTGADNLRNFSGNNAFNGAIRIAQTGGAYQIDSAEAGSTLTLGGGITNTLNSARTLNFIGDGNTLAPGVLAETGGASSVLSVVKSGAGTLTLSGANTYTGATTVNAGTLAVNGTALPNTTKLVINGGVVEPTGTEVVDTLFFGAVQQASGTWGATGSGATHIDDTHFTGTGVVSVTTAAAGYGSWATANAGGQASNLDFDNDGVKNGVEYFMGATSSTFTTNPGIVNGKVTWPKDPAFNGTYSVQTSPDLVTWINVSSTVVGNTVEYTLPTGQTKLFIRLNVTPN